jgi:outer membrane receptor protein involved in Fe transport
MHNFTLSYTLRTSTPSATDLTRFIVFSNESYEIGNTDLLPSHTHNLEGGWNKFFEGFGSVGVDLYYKANTDGQGTLVDVAYHPVYGREVSFSQPFNIGSSHTAGADINLTYRPTAMFNLRLSARAVHMGYHSQFRPGEWVDDNLWAGNLRLNVWGKLWNVLQVFGNVNYTTRQISFLSSYDPFFITDLGVSADLLDRHLSLYLNVKDVFNTYSRSTANTNPYIASGSTTRYSSRYISFGLTLRLGKMELESQARMGNND